MIKFEEHEGKLFRMLEEPVPLTDDAKMPCIIVPIQDDSPMGKYVKQCWGHNEIFMRGKYTICGINANMVKVGFLRDTPLSIHMFEIIGTFVEEGSKDWALYQMMKGFTVSSGKGYPTRLNGNYVCCGSITLAHINDFLSIAVSTGWQIHKESKPELQYKVGDWVEIESSHTKGKTFVSVIKEMPNQEHYTVQVNSFFGGYTVYGIMERQIVRKLKPSEIVVRIGCLSGTIGKSCESACFLMWHSNPKMDFDYSIIKFSALDTQTRELVEGLLKEQNEEKLKGENND